MRERRGEERERVMDIMPQMLAGEALDAALRIAPDYDERIRGAAETERLIALQDLYNEYIPTEMSREIYARLYLALHRSMTKKQSLLAVRQFSENQNRIKGRAFTSIMGGTDSLTIIGESGIGKSAAVSRVMDLISGGRIIELPNSMRIIPCVQVQTPADCSIKGLLFEILRKVDEIFGSRYYYNAARSGATTDMLIGSVSTVVLNHIGLLVVDEIQNVVNSKNGITVVGTLTQLINNAGISICMVGTPKSALFFSQEMMLARRSLGLSYGPFACDETFAGFCRELFRYQYTREWNRMDNALLQWLYNHSLGNAAVVVSLIHDAQELSILDGYEKLDIVSLEKAYQNRMGMLHGYLYQEVVRNRKPAKVKKQAAFGNVMEEAEQSLVSETAARSKRIKKDIIDELMDQGISVSEVSV